MSFASSLFSTAPRTALLDVHAAWGRGVGGLLLGIVLLAVGAVPAAGQSPPESNLFSNVTGVVGGSSIADVDGDGNEDLLITGTDASGSPTATLYLGDGSGGFAEAGAGLTGVSGGSSSIADVDGDESLDLLITGEDENDNPSATLYLGDGSGGFTEANAGLTGVAFGSSSYIADVDGDGNEDLLITGEDENFDPTTTLYLGDGGGGFTEAGAGLTGVENGSSSIGDVDGDGNEDLLITGEDENDNKTATLYLGDGSGGFTEAGAGLTGVEDASSSIGDVDGDGNKDLLITGLDENFDRSATLYLGDGSGGFTEAGAGLTGVSRGSSSTIADVDGDGNEDLLITGGDENYDPSATLYLGDGNGGFTEAGAGLTAVSLSSSSIADVNGDGNEDLLITGRDANDNETATLYLGDGSGGFTEAGMGRGLTGVAFGSSSTIADVDGDGSLDLLITGEDENGEEATLYLGDGNGGFTEAGAGLTGVDGSSSSIADVDGDENLDLLITGSDSSFPFESTTLYLGDGSGGFTEADAGLTNVSSGSSSIADVDGDGNLDLLITGYDGSFNGQRADLYLGDGNGDFTEANAGLTGVDDGSSSIADVDGDGNRDLLITGDTDGRDNNEPSATLYLGDGSGGFTEADAGLTGVENSSSSIADVDGDGNLDLLITGSDENFDPTTTLYLGDESGNFTETNAGLTGLSGGSSSIADVNGDGNPDLLITGNLTTTLYLGDGSGGFTETDAGLMGVSRGSSTLGDIDNDGDPDLLITGETANGNRIATLYENLTADDLQVASSVQTVSSNGRVDFAGTGVAINFSGTNGSGDVTAQRFSNAPTNPLGIDESNISSYRFVLSASGDLSFDENTEVRLDVGSLGGIGNASNVTIYKRSVRGTGPFTALETSFDGEANELVATTGAFSEFVLAEGGGGEGALPAPASLTATPTDEPAVTLSWDPVESDALARYRLYRDTAPITGSPSDLSPVDSVDGSTTSFTDEPDLGQTYYYRVTAVDTSGGESGFSNEASAFLYPQEVSASASRTFGGATDSSGYRLVALPGQADRPIGDAVSGEAGSQWQAYYDDGSDSEYLVEFDGSDTFRFQTGNGFWLTATSEWTFEESISTVDLRGDSATAIALREGWNVISNPLGKDVDWASVEAATGGSLQPLWGFAGSFTEPDTFRSARSGTAYYFFNDSSERDSLVIPYPGAPGMEKSQQKAEEAPMLAVTATSANARKAAGSTVRVGIGEEAERGLGPEDLIAPPGRFAETSLRIEAPGETDSKRARSLMAERRPRGDEGGQTFRLRLTSRADGPVRLTADHLDAVEGQSVALLHPEAGTTYDLRQEETVEIEPDGESAQLKLAVGTESYVEDQTDKVLPEEVTLTSYPNPARRQGTVEYALPEGKKVTLRLYDVLGREVATLAQGRKDAGRHRVRLDADRLASGVYFGRLQAGDRTLTQKITVVR